MPSYVPPIPGGLHGFNLTTPAGGWANYRAPLPPVPKMGNAPPIPGGFGHFNLTPPPGGWDGTGTGATGTPTPAPRPTDPFARYALNLTATPWGNLTQATKGMLDANPAQAYAYATASSRANPAMPGAINDWFARQAPNMLARYQAASTAAGSNQFPSYYDWLQSNWNPGMDFYSQSPTTRGSFAGLAPSQSRFVRSF